MSDERKRSFGMPRWALLSVFALLLAGLVLGSRQLVLSLEKDTSASASVGETSTLPPTTSVVESTTTTQPSASTSTTGDADPTGSNPDDTTASGSEDVVVDVGEPDIQPLDHSQFTDLVSIQPGVVPPIVAGDDTGGSGSDDPGTTETGSGDLVIALPDTSNQRAPILHGFGVGATVETDGHIATFSVGIATDGEGLDELTLDFGDGSELALSSSQRRQLEGGGTVDVVHRYEPTLTPQPWTASVTGVNDEGVMRSYAIDFDTQSEFLLSYSPLRVTAIDDCDLFGKGDFVLEWNNDGRDRRSKFDLGQGETYVENEFRVGINDVRYDEPVRLEIGIVESDSMIVDLSKFGLYEILTGDGPLSSAPTELFTNVIDLGSHSYPISVKLRAGDHCHTLMDFVTTLALDERATP